MKKKGFTLLEMVPVLFMLALIMISLGIVLNFGVDLNKRQTLQNDVQGDVSKTMTGISDDIRHGIYFIDYDECSEEAAEKGVNVNTILKNKFNNTFIQYQDDSSTNNDIYEISNNSQFKCLLFIQQVNGNYCLYATKDNELHRFNYNSNPLSLVQESSASSIDKITRDYYHGSYTFKYDSHINVPENFYYYQGSDYFHCITAGSNYSIYKLNRQPVALIPTSHVVLSNNIQSINIQRDDSNDIKSYKVDFTITESRTTVSYTKPIAFSVAITNYGGDQDE